MAIPVTIISLTPEGQSLALSLLKVLPEAQHLHKPKPFTETVQGLFLQDRRLIFICATGIAMRALAPVLADKHSDPAVLVLDEEGQFVIPLMSGHEGGANAWGEWLAQKINAQCIVTGKTHYRRPIYVMGIGCDRGCPEQIITDLAEKVLSTANLQADPVTGDTFISIGSIELKKDETGLLNFATQQGLPIEFHSANRLNDYETRLSYKSDVVFRETGCYGVAEAAALATAENLTGTQAELLIPKQKNARATFSVARAFRTVPIGN